MNRLVLYLTVGYPGAGKTTVSKLIHELTGATHLWADKIRRERFGKPTYTHQENIELYGHLNELAAELLAAKQSVIFDTNFNFFKDREKLRKIAKDHGAEAVVVWVNTDKQTARRRAVDKARLGGTRILGHMPAPDFERMAANLEPPKPEEKALEIVGENVSKNSIERLLRSVALI